MTHKLTITIYWNFFPPAYSAQSFSAIIFKADEKKRKNEIFSPLACSSSHSKSGIIHVALSQVWHSMRRDGTNKRLEHKCVSFSMSQSLVYDGKCAYLQCFSFNWVVSIAIDEQWALGVERTYVRHTEIYGMQLNYWNDISSQLQGTSKHMRRHWMQYRRSINHLATCWKMEMHIECCAPIKDIWFIGHEV